MPQIQSEIHVNNHDVRVYSIPKPFSIEFSDIHNDMLDKKVRWPFCIPHVCIVHNLQINKSHSENAEYDGKQRRKIRAEQKERGERQRGR